MLVLISVTVCPITGYNSIVPIVGLLDQLMIGKLPGVRIRGSLGKLLSVGLIELETLNDQFIVRNCGPTGGWERFDPRLIRRGYSTAYGGGG